MSSSREIRVASVFADSSDSENEDKIESECKLLPTASVADYYAEDVMRAALAEDPTIFDFDGSLELEDSSSHRKRPHLETAASHRHLKFLASTGSSSKHDSSKREGPKYMSNLLAQAEARKVQNELTKLRMARKRAAEENDNGTAEEEAFVTEAYKEKLKELEEKEKKLAALQMGMATGEEVAQKQNMDDFYLNLMKRNVAFGGQMARHKPVVEAESIATTELDQSLYGPIESEEEISFGPCRPAFKK